MHIAFAPVYVTASSFCKIEIFAQIIALFIQVFMLDLRWVCIRFQLPLLFVCPFKGDFGD